VIRVGLRRGTRHAACALLSLLALAPAVAHASKPSPHSRASNMIAPSDPAFGRQWALRSARVPEAWRTTVGGEVVVAVLDSGIDFSNPDLASNLWTNPGEVPGNRVDDDGNGYVDDVHGADTVNADGDPADGLGHGTAVAGVIGARGDNGVGISGVVVHDRGWASTGSIVAGLRYALANGARIVNISLNGPESSPALDEAIAQAEAQGALVIASAGNDGANRDRVASFPASVSSGAVITVASANRAGRLARGSAYGRGSVDIAAPGDDVLTSELGGRLGRRSGTSFAAAHVTGAAALLAAARPGASGSRLRAALVGSARRGGRVDSAIAGGQLDVAAALERLGRLRSP
jgi:subtilisin family serine protease